jgi:hypothetical protein
MSVWSQGSLMTLRNSLLAETVYSLPCRITVTLCPEGGQSLGRRF